MVVLFTSTLIVSFLTNFFRRDSLKTKIVISQIDTLSPIVIGFDTSYIRYDSVLTGQKRISLVVITNYVSKEERHDTIKIEPITTLVDFLKKKDSLFVYTKAGEYLRFDRTLPITINDKNSNVLITYKELYVGDNWTQAFTLPAKRTLYELNLQLSMADKLNPLKN